MQWITYHLFEREPTPTPMIKRVMVPRVTAGARFKRVKRNRAISPHPDVKVTKALWQKVVWSEIYILFTTMVDYWLIRIH